jgi:cell division protein FtsI (penicillin-binding protein 3)/stage V sporulation protein D (sporulation-specific penicillin-binding protein)
MVAILLVFALFATAAGLRLGYWQVVAADELTAQVIEDRASTAVSRTVRADIIDRDGVLLAKTASYDRLDAHPDIIRPEDQEAIAETLGLILDLDLDERRGILEKLASGAQFVVLRPELALEESAAVEAARDAGLLPGVKLTARETRYYPRRGGESGTSLASQLLGFVDAEGRGAEGVERYYDDQLTVTDPGSLELASLDGVPIGLEGIDPPPLKLTIDAKLQKQVERELNTARIANRAKSASAIVMDPHTGAILAAASVPSYNANEYATIATEDMSRLRNPVFSDQYEPGSVMKIFTVTAALDLELVKPTTIIHDSYELEFWKYEVHNSDLGSEGRLTVKDVIAKSRNVATAKIAMKLAPRSTQKAAHRLYDLWEKVGVADRTGVDVANEATGSAFDPDQRTWAPVDLANRAFGQGVAVTLVQLARGVSTLVNGGYLVQPHLVADGEAAGVEKQRVLKAKVARQAQDILTHVTGSRTHYARGTLIRGYKIGGKTGTAQIWDPAMWNKELQAPGDWKKNRFNHSFVGYIGGKRPEVVIAVRLEEPVPIKNEQGNIPLRIESYELFQMLARASIKHLDIRKSKDPNAGRPIAGTDAAKALDPVRNRALMQKAKREAAREERQEAKAAKAQKARRDKGDEPDLAAAVERGVNTSGSGST